MHIFGRSSRLRGLLDLHFPSFCGFILPISYNIFFTCPMLFTGAPSELQQRPRVFLIHLPHYVQKMIKEHDLWCGSLKRGRPCGDAPPFYAPPPRIFLTENNWLTVWVCRGGGERLSRIFAMGTWKGHLQKEGMWERWKMILSHMTENRVDPALGLSPIVCDVWEEP